MRHMCNTICGSIIYINMVDTWKVCIKIYRLIHIYLQTLCRYIKLILVTFLKISFLVTVNVYDKMESCLKKCGH